MQVKVSSVFRTTGWCVGALALASLLASSVALAEEPDRRILPLEVRVEGGKVGPTVQTSQMPKIIPVTAPAGAPNVVVVLLDDVGFSASSTFGGAIATPALDKLAGEGVSYTRFHTTALCSPTRAALLTGRNHHNVGAGNITEFATGFSGYNSVIGKDSATVAEVLKGNGYNTAMFGKWHNTPVWETSAAGPFDRWPTGMGFEEFYGFLGGEAHQYFPGLFHGTTPTERPEHAENYHLTTDLVDHALQWTSTQQAMAPGKPFFMYFAPGATHAPHQAPSEWVEPYKGKFDQGWDKLREETFERQKRLGVIPADAELTARDPSIPAWDSLTPERKKIAARLMEVYAGFLAHTDYEIGRLEQGFKDQGVWDNTLFIYIVGDNGAAPAGGLQGVFNEMTFLNGVAEDEKVVLSRLDEIGGPKANNEYPVGFAWAMGTPFKYTKAWASHFGGTRNPMVISWPAKLKQHGELRTQFHHVTDVLPTILEAAGLPAPEKVNGVAQKPVDGISMLYSLNDAKAAERRKTQYFELYGTRGLYHDGWMAATSHNRAYSKNQPGVPAFTEDKWELYNLDRDFSQANDLAAQYPDKLKALQAIFEQQAQANNVYPLDDRGAARVINARPSILGTRQEFTLRAGAVRIPEDLIRNTFNRSFSIEADLKLDKPGNVQGVIATAGGYYGGFSLFIKDGKPFYTYNYFGSEYTTLEGTRPLPQGPVKLRYKFTYDGGGIGKGGQARLLVNGEPVAEKRIERIVPLGFSADETLDIGMDTGTPGSDRYEGNFPFNATIDQVKFSLQ